jgi:hypothetical protein
MKLYEIANEFRELIDSGLEKEDEQCFKDTWQALEGELNDKLRSCIGFVKAQERLAESQIARGKELQELGKKAQKRLEGFLEYIERNIPEKYHYACADGELGWTTTTRTELKVPESEIPMQYKKEKVSYTVSKTDLKTDVLNGSTEAAKYATVTKKARLRIK